MLEYIQFSVFVVCGITPFRIYVFYLGGLRRLCLYDWVVYFLCFCVWIFRIHCQEFIISIFALGCVAGVAPWQGAPCMERHLWSVWPRRRLGWHWPASTLLALAGPLRIQGWRGSSPLWLLPSKIIPALQVVLLWVTFTSACHSRYNYNPPETKFRGVYWIHPVRPSVCPSVCLSVRPSVRGSVSGW